MQKDVINYHLGRATYPIYVEEEPPKPKSEVWYPPEDDGGSLDSILRKMNLNDPKYDWRKSTTKGRFSNKNLSIFLFDIL